MHRKLTISVDEDVYTGLHSVIGRGHISQFIEDLVRSNLFIGDLEAGYRALAADEVDAAEALEWSEAFIGETLVGEPYDETW